MLQTYSGKILYHSNPLVLKVSKIVKRLAENVKEFVPEANIDFKLYVVDSQEANAFVLPGGQIFVFTGLLPIAKTEEGLATVLAHEVTQLFFKTTPVFI